MLGPRLCFASLVLAGTIGAAAAADLGSAPPYPMSAWRVIDEIRGGVFAHDPSSPEGGSVDLNAELLSSRLPLIDPASPWVWASPRLHVGGMLNTGGRTSHVYTGLTWTVDLYAGFFLDASFGAGFHDGKTGNSVPKGWNQLGCSPLFRESASLGYRLTANLSIMATVEHLSNAGLCDQNRGLTNVGGRIGYTF